MIELIIDLVDENQTSIVTRVNIDEPKTSQLPDLSKILNLKYYIFLRHIS